MAKLRGPAADSLRGEDGARETGGVMGVRDAASLFALLGSPSRLRLLKALAEGGGRDGRELSEVCGLSRSGLSHQLALLRLAGIVACRTDGQLHRYELRSSFVRDLLRRVR